MTDANDKAVATKPALKMRYVDQAAILLMSLGEADAAEILKHMGPKEVQRIGGAMTQLQNVQQSEVQLVLANFLDEVHTLTGLGVGAVGHDANGMQRATW